MDNDFDPFDFDAQDVDAEAQALANQLQAKKDKDDFLWLMNDKRGRRVMWKLLSMTHVFRSSYTGDNGTEFREGERNIGCRLLDEIHTHCPQLYSTMVTERSHDNRDIGSSV